MRIGGREQPEVEGLKASTACLSLALGMSQVYSAPQMQCYASPGRFAKTTWLRKWRPGPSAMHSFLLFQRLQTVPTSCASLASHAPSSRRLCSLTELFAVPMRSLLSSHCRSSDCVLSHPHPNTCTSINSIMSVWM